MLQGERVTLRAIDRTSLPTFVRWFNDPDVIRHLTLHLPMSLAQEERWFEQQLPDNSKHIFGIETEDRVHFGNIGLHDLNWNNRNTELGITIGEKEYWSQGYGTDAVLTLLRFAFEELHLHRVSLIVYDHNDRAKCCNEKCRFRYEGRNREEWFSGGKYHDELSMSILGSEFHKYLT